MGGDGDKKRKKSLAEQLGSLDLNLRQQQRPRAPQRQSEERDSSWGAKDDSLRGDDAQREAPEESRRPLNDRELFEQAVQGLDAAQIYEAKYQGSAAAELPPAPTADVEEQSPSPAGGFAGEALEEEARQRVQEARDAALFEQMVGSVEPILDRAKYRPPRRTNPAPSAAPPLPPADRKLSTPALPTDGEGLNFVPRFNGQQRSLKKRHARYAIANEIPQLNLRGDNREDALRQLELFIHQFWKDQARFVRVIHGRGLRSEDEPILKPAILEWLEGPGERYLRGYIPERNQAGDYGSLIIELERSR